MTTQATAACPIQLSVVLDSGVFLTFVDEEKKPDCEIGYFAPEFMIYRNGHLIASSTLSQPIAPADETQQTTSPDDMHPVASLSLPSARIGSREIAFRHIRANGDEEKGGVTLSHSMRKNLLRKEQIYAGATYSPPIIEARFDWILRFYSGFFRCSSVKDRYFKQCDGATNLPNAKRKMFGKIAHDVVVQFEMSQDDQFEITVGGEFFWNSSSSVEKDPAKRFDIEVIGPHATAENYFRDALDHRGHDYWVPNQGDPGPMGGRP